MSHQSPEDVRQQQAEPDQYRYDQPGQHDEGQSPPEQSPELVGSTDVRSGGHAPASSLPGTESDRRPGTARMALQVDAGVLPGTPIPEHTKRWIVTSGEWQQHGYQALGERYADASSYALQLMMRPEQFNWVRTEWVWL